MHCKQTKNDCSWAGHFYILSCDPSDHLQKSPKIAKESQKESFWWSAKKSQKIPDKVKKYPQKSDLEYFLTFSGIFWDFFADHQKDSF